MPKISGACGITGTLLLLGWVIVAAGDNATVNALHAPDWAVWTIGLVAVAFIGLAMLAYDNDR